MSLTMAKGWMNWVSWMKPAATGVPQPAENDSLKLCKGIIDKLEDLITFDRSSQEYLMNEKQCLLLVKRLSETLAEIQHSSRLDDETSPVLQEFRNVFVDAHRLIQSCCIKATTSNAERLRAAIELGDMKDTFAKLLYDIEWHTDVLQSILDDSEDPSTTFEAARCMGNLSPKDKLALMNAKENDDKVLNDRLRNLELDDPTERDLAVQLLEQRGVQATKAQSRSSLRHGVLFLDPPKMEKHVDGKQIGKGSVGTVQETDVLGGNFAVKILDEPEESIVENDVSMFMKEMEAMQGLGHHPHIVRLYCYSRIVDRCFLVMERMNCDLDRILRHKKDYLIVEKVALMLEIAEGMRYIHRMHMAHRDLKPGNVLVNLEDPTNKSSRACSVKIADFGLTKTKYASKTYKDQTTNTGTARYMAPEVIDFNRNLRPEFNPAKADVYSFGIMCFEILTGKTAFGDRIEIGKLKKQVKRSGNFRPDLLQGSGPLRLESLIRMCWDANHHSRPPFSKICQELRYIKGLLLRGDDGKLKTKINFTNELRSTDNMTAQGQDVVSKKGTAQFSHVAASAKATPVRQGPWGRNEPSKKTGLFDHMAATIKWIRVKYQQDPPGLGLLQVGYLEAGGQEVMETYCQGIIGTTYTEIKLEPVEYIKQVSGCVATHPVSVGKGGTVGLYCVASLTIHTNFKSYGPFGDETKCASGQRFKSGTGKVVGLFGAAGVLLDKLGVWIIPDGQEDGDPSCTVDQ